MLKTKHIILLIAVALLLLLFVSNKIGKMAPKKFELIEEEASLFPDYKQLMIPPNIAPLNFKITHAGEKHIVVFSNGNYQFSVSSNKKSLNITKRKWKKLISGNSSYTVDIYSKQNKTWVKYPSILNNISADPIDSYIVFRHIDAGYILWGDMGIYQRNLENFTKKPILLNKSTDQNCMNCHTFHKNDPSKMLIHLRGGPSGTLLYNEGEISFINTKTNYTMSSGVYPSWHPNGNIIAFSVNLINQKFHNAGTEHINVFDRASDIVTYNIEKKEISTSPELSTKSLENLPNWSPCGKYLYYISSNNYEVNIEPTDVKYNLLRIAYNEHTNLWGQVDTLLTSEETGLSISFPEVSPDGKYLIFCMAKYGYFTIHRNSSDLYIMDLETLDYKAIEVANSEYTESYHSWSSNSKWFLFVSKRIDGLYSRVYFCHVDENGEVSKPILLPQRNAAYYGVSTVNYNRPTFITHKVDVKSYRLSKKAFDELLVANFDANIDVDALSGASFIKQ